MPPPKKDNARRKPAAASSNARNAVARPRGTVLPNVSLPDGTTLTNISTITSATSSSSSTSRNTSNRITVNRFPLPNPEVSLLRLPISTNETTGDHAGNQDDDDVVYLYTVDSRPAQRVAEEVDLTQELEEEIPEPPEPSKKTVTKAPKTRKRKIEEDGVAKKVAKKVVKKRKAIGYAACNLCNIENEDLTKMKEDMLLGSCGHLYCAPCKRKEKLSYCDLCELKILKFRKVYF